MKKTLKKVVAGVAAVLLPHMASAGEAVDYSVGGQTYEGYSAKAKGTSKGLILILHDWDGLTDYEKKRAEMLAELGYDAFAADLFGKGNRPTELSAKKAETGKLYQDRAAMRQRMLAALQAAQGQTNQPVAIVGYCFGGSAGLELARSGQGDAVKGFAIFHGGLTTPDGQSYPAKTPPLLIAHGGGDTSVSLQDVAQLASELEKANATYKVEIYSGAPHAFTVFGSDRYRQAADEKSWVALRAFLTEIF